jgi:hypothetical protein
VRMRRVNFRSRRNVSSHSDFSMAQPPSKLLQLGVLARADK